MLLAGCWGESGLDPQLEQRQRELSKRTVRTAEQPVHNRRPLVGDGALEDGEDAGTDDAPAPPDSSDPGEPGVSADRPRIYSDDSVRCGNGLLDPDEICEIALREGQEGACPSACPDDDPCRPMELEVRTCWTVCVPVQPDREACPESAEQ